MSEPKDNPNPKYPVIKVGTGGHPEDRKICRYCEHLYVKSRQEGQYTVCVPMCDLTHQVRDKNTQACQYFTLADVLLVEERNDALQPTWTDEKRSRPGNSVDREMR